MLQETKLGTTSYSLVKIYCMYSAKFRINVKALKSRPLISSVAKLELQGAASFWWSQSRNAMQLQLQTGARAAGRA
jgi:hypothetical protein